MKERGVSQGRRESKEERVQAGFHLNMSTTNHSMMQGGLQRTAHE